MADIMTRGLTPLIKGGTWAFNQKCCCGQPDVQIAINLVNINKWSDSARTATINGNTLTAPNVEADTKCGGGFWSTVSPLPDYCPIGFSCCGAQVGGSSTSCLGCDGTTYGAHAFTAGLYPATGCKGEDCGCSNAGGTSLSQVCGTLGDCSGDLVKATFSRSWLIFGGTNTFVTAGSGRCSGDYGIVEIFKIKFTGTAWIADSTLVSSTYGTGSNSYTFSL